MELDVTVLSVFRLGAGGVCELQKMVKKQKLRSNPSWGFLV